MLPVRVGQKPVPCWESVCARCSDGRNRAKSGKDGRRRRNFSSANKLSDSERQAVLSMTNSAEFATLAPSQIMPILAERGQYLASESAFYRILREAKQLQHRQASRAVTGC
jgi:putative transposase